MHLDKTQAFLSLTKSTVFARIGMTRNYFAPPEAEKLVALQSLAYLVTEKLGCATGRTTRVPKGRSRNSAQDRSPDADDLEIWRGLSLDKGGHCLI